MYATLLAHPDLRRYDLRSIEACISGAAPLPEPVQVEFERVTGGRLVEGYGLIEASPVTHCNPIHGRRKLGSIGLPFPSTEAVVVDPETRRRILPPGEPGELLIRGPQVMAGYWNRPDETAATLNDGWLATGDIATVDEEGFFRIVDRRKDLIKVSGVNVYPREVEDVLLDHPAVAEAAVIGVSHPIRGEVPKAFVVLRPGATVSDADLLAHCRANLAPYKVPAAIEFRTELPRTFVGKVLRRVLAEEEAARAEPSKG
jgi:long-chain acyl-CoA synthetase